MKYYLCKYKDKEFRQLMTSLNLAPIRYDYIKQWCRYYEGQAGWLVAIYLENDHIGELPSHFILYENPYKNRSNGKQIFKERWEYLGFQNDKWISEVFDNYDDFKTCMRKWFGWLLCDAEKIKVAGSSLYSIVKKSCFEEVEEHK